MDIRNTFPEIYNYIDIYGNLSKILTMEQFSHLRKTCRILEYGCDFDGVSHLRLQGLFTLDDVKKKIREICDKEE